MSQICPLCERGELRSQVVEETIRYDGVNLAVPGIEISVCSACGEEVIAPAQAKANELRFADAKRHHDGLLTSDEIVAIRELWGLTQSAAAKLFGGGPNAFSKYERGEVMQSKALDVLLRAYNEVSQLRTYLSGERNMKWTFDDPVAPWRVTAHRDISAFYREVLSEPSIDSMGWQDDETSNVIELGFRPEREARRVPEGAQILGKGRWMPVSREQAWEEPAYASPLH